MKKAKRLPDYPMEGIVFRLVECLNETVAIAMDEDLKASDALFLRCVQLFRVIDALCGYFDIEMPEEAVSANVTLDGHFHKDILEGSRKSYTELVTELFL